MADAQIPRAAIEAAARVLAEADARAAAEGDEPAKRWEDLAPSKQFRWAVRAKAALDAAAPLIVADAFERVADNVDTDRDSYDGPCTTGFKSGQEWFKTILREHAELLRAQS